MATLQTAVLAILFIIEGMKYIVIEQWFYNFYSIVKLIHIYI